MYIKKICLNNFRNYFEEKIELDEKINIFYGDNAQGKTNIIESVFIASLGKSFRTKKDNEVINFEKDKASLEFDYKKSDREGNIKIEIQDKKNIYLNKLRIKKISEMIGNVYTVLFTPDDINIFKEAPTRRRKFLDILISQLRPMYLYNLNLYLKTLEQRNMYLKQIKYENKDEKLLDIWDEKLLTHGEKVWNYRCEFIKKISNKIKSIHLNNTDNAENIEIEYITDFKGKEEFLEILRRNRKNDIIKGYTTKGIHKDDFITNINGKLVGVYGSQGQNRTAVLSLKITELEIYKDEVGEYPILLLDDFLSELDKKRRNCLLKSINNIQVIITCTDKINDINATFFRVEKGKIEKE